MYGPYFHTWKVGDVADLELNDWCGSKARVTIEKIFKDGNCRLRTERENRIVLNHVSNLKEIPKAP